MREFERVGVVGLGTMGAGIVEVFARNGHAVTAVEISDAALERGRATLAGSVDRAVKKGKLTAEERDALLRNVSFEVGLGALHSVDLVIEAVPERLDLKQKIFAELDRVTKPGAILATNTSSLSVTEISVATHRPDHVIGMHFFNPAPIMKLIEVVRTVVTAADVVADIEALCKRLGKVDVTIGDRAGFVANALLFGYLNHAVAMVETHYASREDIDAAMKLGCGLPMGPLALLDLIGIDTAYEILDTMYRHGGRDRRHAPNPLIKQMVTAGLLGRKSGRGFYSYGEAAAPSPAGAVVTSHGVGAVGVVGGGAVAAGIVEAFTAGGFEVVQVDPAAGLARLAGVDLVVEAVAGDLASTKALFASLDEVCKPGTVLATAGSTLPVIELAMATGRPADVVGLHFVDAVVEVVRTVRTADETIATATAVVGALGKQPVSCGDRAGLIVEALLLPYLNDAVRMVEAAYSTAEDIDNAMKLGCGYPMGPFEQLDAVGLDVALATQRALYEEQREPGLAPAPLLVHLVTAGRGFR